MGNPINMEAGNGSKKRPKNRFAKKIGITIPKYNAFTVM